MVCIFCLDADTKVFNSRKGTKLNNIWRRRRCQGCNAEFTTYEKADASSILMVQKHKRIIPYSPARVLLDLISSFLHVAEPSQTVTYLADTIERKLYSKAAKNKTHSITTNDITEVVAETLRAYDATAYITYAAKHNLLNKTALQTVIAKPIF